MMRTLSEALVLGLHARGSRHQSLLHGWVLRVFEQLQLGAVLVLVDALDPCERADQRRQREGGPGAAQVLGFQARARAERVPREEEGGTQRRNREGAYLGARGALHERGDAAEREVPRRQGRCTQPSSPQP